MRPAGLTAFERRTDERSAIYSYEQRKDATLDPVAERFFRANKKAWAFFQAKAPGYRKTAIWWVISAKRAETRQKRLATLIGDSEHGRTIGPLRRRPSPSSLP
ncbi:MAG TPA: YdeI/OmpD-associated family protein [Candidatus Dormibacteraeota bacterium]